MGNSFMVYSNNSERKRHFEMPWRSDSSCFNFKCPTFKVSADEIEILVDLAEQVNTLVINCELEDYSFIQKLVHLEQLYFYKGKNITDLSFLENLLELRQLCIIECNVSSYEPLVALMDKKSKLINSFDDYIKYGMECIYLYSYKYGGEGSELNNYLRIKECIIVPNEN